MGEGITLEQSFRDRPHVAEGFRSQAYEALKARGLPDSKREGWQQMPLRGLLKETFAPDAASENSAAVEAVLASLGGLGQGAIVVANGQVVATPSLEGVEVEAFSGAEPSGWATEDIGRLAPADDFAALNAVMFDGGVAIRITKDTDVAATIRVVYVAASGADVRVSYPRTFVCIEAGARAKLAEIFVGDDGAQLTNSVTEIVVGDNAQLEHIRGQLGGVNQRRVATVAVKQGRDSRYLARTISLGSALERTDLRVLFAAPGGECDLAGVYHVDGRDHVEHHLFLDHASDHCSSRQNYRGLADGSGTAVFDGIVVVRRGAQKTAAHQQNRNLLLSDAASIFTKPHLEIDADDIVASHGATIGALDSEQLFYLRSRGIPEAQARAALTAAFVDSILDEIGDDELGQLFRRRLHARLPGDVNEQGLFGEEIV